MLGASIALAIQSGTASPTSWVFIAIVALVLHAVNFYHGKMMAFEVVRVIETEARPVYRSVLLLANSVLFLVFCVMAAKVTSPIYIAGGESALRVVDIGVVASELRIGDSFAGRQSMAPALRSQFGYWQRMNVVALLLNVGLLVALPSLPHHARYPLVVGILAALVAIDLVIEYWGFRANYFHDRSDGWNVLAERWDRLQGRYGDQYRRAVIHPHIEMWLVREQIDGCIDVGCGNGCTARFIAEQKGLPTVGIDAAAEMIELAELYEPELKSDKGLAPTYLVGAADRMPPHDAGVYDRLLRAVNMLRDGGRARVGAIAIFTPQDCESLQGFFDVSAGLLKQGEPMLMVFENKVSFNPTLPHTTTQRTWKYRLGRERERMQVVTWLPVTVTAASSRYAELGPDLLPPINVETHYRTFDDYRLHAGRAGFEVTAQGDLALGRRPTTPLDLAYGRSPRFAFIELVRIERSES
jgi:SAM-dependent methyltransferase